MEILKFVHILLFLITWTSCQEPPFFLKASKSVPRIGRSRSSPDDFENFFLKASKSVPRIGRRNYQPSEKLKIDLDPPIVYYTHQERPIIYKKAGNHFKEVPWTELSEMVEYYPEIMLMSPPMWADGAMRDNYQFEDFGKRQNINRNQEFVNNNSPNSEIPTYKQLPVP